MTNLAQKLTDLIEEIISDFPELFLIELLISGTDGNQRVLVLIDSESGLSIESCSMVSRKLSIKIEELELIEGKYNLEVSSPGIDRPLSKLRQYQKNIGRRLQIESLEGKTFDGILKSIVDEKKIVVSLGDTDETMLLEEIKKAKILISFN
jgi:ribosome maturation factor RimP